LAAGLARRRDGLRAALKAAPRGKEELHRLRLEAKKMRYVLDALSLRGAVLRELQGHLGRAHDLEVLQQLLGDHPGAARDEARARDAALRVMRSAVARAEGELRKAAGVGAST
jgi:CHAD domain-containing protein